MKWTYILLIGTLLLCSSGIVSAANATNATNTFVIGGIVDMDKVIDHGKTFWDSANRNGGAGYLLLGIGFVVWLLAMLYCIFGGGASYAIGDSSNNADATKRGTDQLKRVAVAIAVVPVLIIVLGIFAGLI